MVSRFRRTVSGTVLVALAGAVVLVLSPQPVRAQGSELPTDLAMVPGDAAGFVHLKLSTIWKHDMMRTVRDTIQSAGVRALTAFEKQVYPSPSTLESATIVLLPPKDDREPPTVVGIIRFNQEIDQSKILSLYVPNAITAKANGKTIYADRQTEIGLHFADSKHLVIGPAQMVEAFLQRPPVLTGAMRRAVEESANGLAVVACVSIKALPIPPEAYRDVPENVLPLLKAERIALAMDLKDKAPKVYMHAYYGSKQAANEAEDALKDGIKILKVLMTQPKQQFERALFAKENDGPRQAEELPELIGALAGLGAIQRGNEFLDNLPIRKYGNQLSMSFTVPAEFNQFAGVYPVALGFLLPAVQKVREAASRTQGANNLKQIGLAMHNYHDTYNKMATDIYDKNGKPLLSWRVQILPYIEQDQLYRQFKLDEPWDSEHNKKLIDKMPQIYIVPSARPQPRGRTYYQGFTCAKGTSPRSFFIDDPKARTSFNNITDGTSNSLMIVEAAEAVEWTKPADMVYDPKKDLPKLGGHSVGGFNALLGDGSVRFIRDTIDKTVLKALITIDGGEVVNYD